MDHLHFIDDDKLKKFRNIISKHKFFGSKKIFNKKSNKSENLFKKFILIFVLLLLEINNFLTFNLNKYLI
jgi:hypothetical protein